MVAEVDVWAAADRIRARAKPDCAPGERVSVRNVRRELGRGSFESIGPALARWKARTGYQAVIETAGLPEALQNRLAEFGAALLEHVRIEWTRHDLTGLANGERAAFREMLDEALAHADVMEARAAALQAEVERLRNGSAVPVPSFPSAPTPETGAPSATAGFIGILMGKSLAREADAYWDEVRAAVDAAMRRQGPLAVHALHGALPAALKDRGARIGMPLTPAWLRYRLLRLAEGGQGVTEAGGRFALAEPSRSAPAPGAPPSDRAVPPALSGRRFWTLFVAEVHDLLLEAGPLSVDDILDKLPPGWVEATRRYGKADDQGTVPPGKLREKLNVRIAKGRPLKEMDDGRFAATYRWPGSRTLSDEEAA
ncbi:DNA-binding protein [Methylobacterium sp. JK268]